MALRLGCVRAQEPQCHDDVSPGHDLSVTAWQHSRQRSTRSTPFISEATATAGAFLIHGFEPGSSVPNLDEVQAPSRKARDFSRPKTTESSTPLIQRGSLT